MKRKDPAELLLRLLLSGETIEHNGHTYGMSEEGELLMATKRIQMIKFGEFEEKEIFLVVPCDISDFYEMANEIGFDALALQCCAISLRGTENGKRVGASS